MRAVQLALILVFAGAQTLARADCCCSAPPAPKAAAHDCCPTEAPAPEHADCACDAPEFRSDLEPLAAPAAVLDAPSLSPAPPVLVALPAGAPVPAAAEPRPPDRDVGPLHLRLHVLLV